MARLWDWKVWPGCGTGRYGQAVGLEGMAQAVGLEGMARLWDCLYLQGMAQAVGLEGMAWLWDSIVYLEGMAWLWDSIVYLEGMAQAVGLHCVPGRYGPGCGTPLCTWKVWPGCGTACTWKVWPRLWDSLNLEGMAQAVGLHSVPGRYGPGCGPA